MPEQRKGKAKNVFLALPLGFWLSNDCLTMNINLTAQERISTKIA